MADNRHNYSYKANASLVLQSGRTSRGKEPTGEAESLRNTLVGRMGDRVSRSVPDELIERRKKAQEKRAKKQKSESVFRDKAFLSSRRGRNVLTETEDLNTGGYRPKTRESKEAFESLLALVNEKLGDQPHSLLLDAANEIVAALKDTITNNNAIKLKARLESLLFTSLREHEVHAFVNLGERINDFSAEELAGSDNPASGPVTEADETVAVIIDDENDDDDESDLDEVRDIVSDDEDSYVEGENGTQAAVDGSNVQGRDSEPGSAAGISRTNVEGSDSDSDVDMGPSRNTGAAKQHGLLSVHEIDAYWLQRQMSNNVDNDANNAQKLAVQVLESLGEDDERASETKLVALLGQERFGLIRTLLLNRKRVYYCTRYKQAQGGDQELKDIEREMASDDNGGAQVLSELRKTVDAASWEQDRMRQIEGRAEHEAKNLLGKRNSVISGSRGRKPEAKADSQEPKELERSGGAANGSAMRPSQTLDLSLLAFTQGDHTMSERTLKLPEKSLMKATFKGYEEYMVAPPKHKPFADGERLLPINELPAWAQPPFSAKGIKSLNRIQSKIYPSAMEYDGNLLVCAPTGAGKTNVAVCTILREAGKYVNRESGKIDQKRMQESMKIVYIAPMKALVQEVVTNFTQRLTDSMGIKVRELSGDQQLSKAEIADTQIIVTTPEKWDIITRKAGDRAYTQLVKLVIIDEIHLLHNERGAVLEAIVVRTLRQVEETQVPVRIVGISATLPNYQDVSTFLRVDPEKGLFFFDNSFRPVPLHQQYIGITEKKAIKRMQMANTICYDKVVASSNDNPSNQTIVFVHSRKETVKTAMALKDMAFERDELNVFLKDDSVTQEILRDMANDEMLSSSDLKELLPFGFAVHHAGMTRADRNCVEDLFAQKHVKVLVSTATLAWGVNLPAHTVIIKGTQVYNPEKGRWVELSQLDILQMLGRAGRPQFDTNGEGIIITTNSEIQYYLSLLNEQLPIESQTIRMLPDTLNAEIVNGSIQNVAEGARWLKYTYLYVRMLQNPVLYGISVAELERDPALDQRVVNLVHSAAILLDKAELIKYDRRTGAFQASALGRVASHYYVSHASIRVYNEYLQSTMSDMEILSVFSMSSEFSNIMVRDEEKVELKKLLERVPIPVKEMADEPTAKVNVLLQAFISRLPLNGYAMACDLVYIHQSAGRIMRALHEICLSRGWASLSEKCLNLCKMVDHRIWQSQSPLRQFPGQLSEKILRKMERSNIPWARYYDLTAQDLGEQVGQPKMGKKLHRLIRCFPKLDLLAHVQPITRTTLNVELVLTADFEFVTSYHGYAQMFWIVVEDVDGDRILYHEPFLLKQQHATKEQHKVNFSVPLQEPVPPHYFIKVVSDRFLHATYSVPCRLSHLILPSKFQPHTELLDMRPIPVTDLGKPGAEVLNAACPGIKELNPIQTQTFATLAEKDDNVLIAAPAGSGKTVCGLLAILRAFSKDPDALVVWIAPFEALAARALAMLEELFGENSPMGKTVVQLTGEGTKDDKLIHVANIVVALPEHWDSASCQWNSGKKRKARIQLLDLLIVDELHLLAHRALGAAIEVAVTRMRYMASQTKRPLRVVGLAASLANAVDIGGWLGCTKKTVFSFHPSVRPVPLEVYVQGFSAPGPGLLALAMCKPTYNALRLHGGSSGKAAPAIVFVGSRRQCELTAVDLISFARAEAGGQERAFGGGPPLPAATRKAVAHKSLQLYLEEGVAVYHEGLSAQDRKLVETLFAHGVVRVLVAHSALCWELESTCGLVVVMGTSRYDGHEHRHVEYPMADIAQMMGRSCRPQTEPAGKCVLLTHSKMKEYYKKFLYSPLPVESQLDHFLEDHFNAEIVAKTIESPQEAMDYLTWTYYYRRLPQNPIYYNLLGTSTTHIFDHMSELVETTLGNLENSRCITMEEDGESVSAINMGMIAAYYRIHYTTIELFASSLKPTTKMRGLLHILSNSSEFIESVPVRKHEDRVVKDMAMKLPLALFNSEYDAVHTKVYVLLQAHFSRLPLGVDMRGDVRKIVLNAVSLFRAVVDVISSHGWLKPAIAAMELSQMLVQALWSTDSPLLQIPHFTKQTVERCKAAGVESVLDILDMEDDVRTKALQMNERDIVDVANFCNAYPNVDLVYKIPNEDDIVAGERFGVVVTLDRDDSEDDDEEEEEEEVGVVIAPHFPTQKQEGWWVIISDEAGESILGIKYVLMQTKQLNVKMALIAPETPGKHKLRLDVISDSYIGCDRWLDLNISVAEAEDEEMES